MLLCPSKLTVSVSIDLSKATVMPHGMFLGSHCALTTRIDTAYDGEQKASNSSNMVDTSREDLDEDQDEEHFPGDSKRKPITPASITGNGSSSSLPPQIHQSSEDDSPTRHRWITSLQAFIHRIFPSIDMTAIAPIGASSKFQSARNNVSGFALTLGLTGGPIVPEIDYLQGAGKRPQAALKHVKLHVPHASWDVALSLVFFAITINSAILIVAGAAFYYRADSPGQEIVADLHDAFVLLSDTLGKPFGILFAIALLASVHFHSMRESFCRLISRLTLLSSLFLSHSTEPVNQLL